MVKTSPSSAGGAGSIPGRGAKIPHASRQKTKTLNRSNIVTNSIKTKQKKKKYIVIVHFKFHTLLLSFSNPTIPALAFSPQRVSESKHNLFYNFKSSL